MIVNIVKLHRLIKVLDKILCIVSAVRYTINCVPGEEN